MRFLILLAALGALGCGPNVAQPLTREQKLAGTWVGKPTEEKTRKGESFLSEHLGGYTIVLERDGSFSLDWRGLTKAGQWSVSGTTLSLKVDRVLGKTMAQADQGDKPLFNQDTDLTLGADDATLTLLGKVPASQTVVFTKSPN